MGMIKEFKDFAMRGNVMDMAIGIILGGAFGKIVSSFVNDVIMPPIGMLTGGVDFADKKAILQKADEAAEVVEVAIGYGTFINVVIDFIIIAFAIFLVVKLMNAAKKKEEAAPAPPPKQEVLLEEIRDLLKKS